MTELTLQEIRNHIDALHVKLADVSSLTSARYNPVSHQFIVLKQALDTAMLPPVTQWQYRTVKSPEWKTITDDEYNIFQHLSRFEFRQIEV